MATGWRGTLLGPGITRTAPRRAATYVRRDIDPVVRDWLRDATGHGGLLLVVGDAGVGKTRLLYEATRAILGDWTVLAPAWGDGARVGEMAGATVAPPGLLVWLDELQRFVDGPYLTPGSAPIRAETIHRLLDAPRPVIVVASLWPEHLATLRATEPGPGGPRPRYPDAAAILDLAEPHRVDLESFSANERERAARWAPVDGRLASALTDPDYGVTEALAGARELVDRYRGAPPRQRAVLDAAADARRLGYQSPLPAELLCEAAAGYLDGGGVDAVAFRGAVAALTRGHHGALSARTGKDAPLDPVTDASRRTVAGFSLAGFLQQWLARQRRSAGVPDAAWRAFARHATDHGDALRLADAARLRLRADIAEPLYRRAAAAGDPTGRRRLTDLLARQHRLGELRVRADAGDRAAAGVLAHVLARRRHADELAARVTEDDGYALRILAGLLAGHGRLDEAIEVLAARADTGDAYAARLLAGLLAQYGRIDTLRERARRGDPEAARQLVAEAAFRGREDELRRSARRGDAFAACELAGLLAAGGRVEEALAVLRPLADAGHERARVQLASLLGARHREDELRQRAEAGDWDCAARLVSLLGDDGRTGEAMAFLHAWAARFTPGGSPGPATRPPGVSRGPSPTGP